MFSLFKPKETTHTSTTSETAYSPLSTSDSSPDIIDATTAYLRRLATQLLTIYQTFTQPLMTPPVLKSEKLYSEFIIALDEFTQTNNDNISITNINLLYRYLTADFEELGAFKKSAEYKALLGSIQILKNRGHLKQTEKSPIKNHIHPFLLIHDKAYHIKKASPEKEQLESFIQTGTDSPVTVLYSMRCLLNAMKESNATPALCHSVEAIIAAAAVPPPQVEAAPNPLQAPLPAEYKIAVATYNVNNKNPHKDAVEELTDALFIGDNNPDIVVIALQEAKPSWSRGETFSFWSGEDVAERTLKRRKNSAGTELYTILHNDNARAITHPHIPTNLLHHSRTHLVVAYKKTSFLPHQINVISHGRVVQNRDKKGGLYALLQVHNRTLAAIGVHLDSFNPDVARQQAASLITAAQDDLKSRRACLLDGVIIAGDFNTRYDHATLAVDPREISKVSPTKAILGGEEFLSQAATVSINNWIQPAEILRGLQFLNLPGPTYGHQNEILKPNPNRNHLFDYGGLDHVAFQNLNGSNALTFTSENAEIVRPRAPSGWLGRGPQEEISDHAAVIARLMLACPERRNTNAVTLDNIHRSLTDQNKPELFRDYFEYAISATAPVDGHPLPYHLADIDLIEKDITFIIAHLDVLSNQLYNPLYVRLLFGTCEKFSAIKQDGGAFIQAKFQQLLDVKVKEGIMKMPLLSPFRKWLDEHKKPRECYTFNECESFKKLGFFHGQAIPQAIKSALTPTELQQIR